MLAIIYVNPLSDPYGISQMENRADTSSAVSDSPIKLGFFGALCGLLGHIISCLTLVTIFGGAVFCVVWGSLYIEDGIKYSTNGTEEQCVLFDYIAEECQDASDKLATSYDYLAIAQSKCGNQTLYSSDKDYDCPMTLMEMGIEHSCLVLDCEQQEFSFTESSTNINLGIVFVLVGGIPLCCCIGCCILMIFHQNDDDKEAKNENDVDQTPSEGRR